MIGEQRGWEIDQLVFVGGTCGSVKVESFNMNLKLLEVPEGRWDRLRQRMARRLLEAQDTVLRAYFAQKWTNDSVWGRRKSRCRTERSGASRIGCVRVSE